MSDYHQIIYKNYPKSNYPEKLARYLWYNYFSFIKPHLKYNILDIGCGDGTYVKLFQRLGLTAIGIDNEIDLNKEKLPFKNNSFHYVFTKSVIEHITNTKHFLKEIHRILKPGGKVVILTPSWFHNYKDFYNDPTHVKPFHRKGLQDALKLAGFSNVIVDYFYHLPWLWGKPWLLPVALFLRLFSRWKWKNKEENIHRINIRFAQEVQLLGITGK